MGRKRSQAVGQEGSTDGPKQLNSVNALAMLQQRGEVCYGDFLLPPEKRAKRSLTNPVLAHLMTFQGNFQRSLPSVACGVPSAAEVLPRCPNHEPAIRRARSRLLDVSHLNVATQPDLRGKNSVYCLTCTAYDSVGTVC